uniref:F-box domain-containing protein n=1 Tax=Pithovirus LCPAC304 TaxID=2506594 RepID=A0A481Z7E2_9VIRU|nr:MAG: hypothetical protein LCPAC304_00030 [Pithovirus LCPAC304]
MEFLDENLLSIVIQFVPFPEKSKLRLVSTTFNKAFRIKPFNEATIHITKRIFEKTMYILYKDVLFAELVFGDLTVVCLLHTNEETNMFVEYSVDEVKSGKEIKELGALKEIKTIMPLFHLLAFELFHCEFRTCMYTCMDLYNSKWNCFNRNNMCVEFSKYSNHNYVLWSNTIEDSK